MIRKDTTVFRLLASAIVLGGLAALCANTMAGSFFSVVMYFIVAMHCYRWLEQDRAGQQARHDLTKLQLLVFVFPGPYLTTFMYLLRNRRRPIIPIG